MEVIVSPSAGFCYGVKNAMKETCEIRLKKKGNVFTLGPLIHNKDAIKDLEKKGVAQINSLEEIKEIDNNEETTVIIRSHGVSENILLKLQEKGVNIVNVTCPFVIRIQKLAREYYQKGFHIIIIGDKDHPEVIGINGWCYDTATITKDGKDIVNIPEKVCVLVQTTETQENFNSAKKIIETKAKKMVVFNTICKATKNRQTEAEKLSRIAEKMIVIGGTKSSNTKKLYDICIKNCKDTILVENASEIPKSFYVNNNEIKIGVTAGASTPDWIIKEAILKMMDEKKIETNEQMAYMDANDKKISVGQVLTGEVISVNENEVFLNINYKSDGVLPQEEAKPGSESLMNTYSIGQKFIVKVLRIRNEDGYVVLSQRELLRDAAYDELKSAFENKTEIEVIVKELVKGGVVASYNGVRIFIPASHIEITHVEDLSEYLDKTLTISIIEFEEVRKNLRIIGSRRALLKEERQKLIDATWSALEKDQIVSGTVQRITDFGAFVDVNGVDGLLHVSEISWGRVDKPSDLLKIGEEITAKVIEVNKDEKKLSLSTKLLQENPWDSVEDKYPVDGVVLGTVVRFADFGAFVELEPGIDGLVHVSEISHKRIEKPSDVLQIGEEIKAKIIDVNKVDRKIGLSIKAVEEL